MKNITKLQLKWIKEIGTQLLSEGVEFSLNVYKRTENSYPTHEDDLPYLSIGGDEEVTLTLNNIHIHNVKEINFDSTAIKVDNGAPDTIDIPYESINEITVLTDCIL